MESTRSCASTPLPELYPSSALKRSQLPFAVPIQIMVPRLEVKLLTASTVTNNVDVLLLLRPVCSVPTPLNPKP